MFCLKMEYKREFVALSHLLAFAGNPFKTLGDGVLFQNHLAFGAGFFGKQKTN
jgi:hypothetical protein